VHKLRNLCATVNSLRSEPSAEILCAWQATASIDNPVESLGALFDSRELCVENRAMTRDREYGGCGGEMKVYDWCMARTNIDIDEEACRVVMARYHLGTKREAVNFALHLVAADVLGVQEARALRGSGWDGDLAAMRESRAT
jgi:Arc/MetJ family transcription regulator